MNAHYYALRCKDVFSASAAEGRKVIQRVNRKSVESSGAAGRRFRRREGQRVQAIGVGGRRHLRTGDVNADRRGDGGQGNRVFGVSSEGERVRFFAARFEEGIAGRSMGRFAAAAQSAGTSRAMAKDLMGSSDGSSGRGTGGTSEGQAVKRPPDQKTAD